MRENANATMKLLLEILEHDRQHVMLYVAICFAVPAFTLGQVKPNPNVLVEKILLIVSLTLFIAAGVSFYFYVQRIHWKRLEAIGNIMEGDADNLRETLFGSKGIWRTAKHLFLRGQFLLLGAAITYVVFMTLHIFNN